MHQAMSSPRVRGPAYPGGFDTLGHFHANSLPMGKRLMSNIPTLRVHFV